MSELSPQEKKDLLSSLVSGERACVHQGERCWPCQTGQCYDQPTEHVWWDSDDVEHARNTGQPDPAGLCGCAFCGWLALGLPGPHAGEDETR
jgi:hypothetical protein